MGKFTVIPHGSPLMDNEPTFTVRGKDPLAVVALKAYIAACGDDAGDLTTLLAWFEAWQDNNGIYSAGRVPADRDAKFADAEVEG